MNKKKEVLLHACCANCAASCVERLVSEGYQPSLFYTNSNIDTENEFIKRSRNVHDLAKHAKLPFYEDNYNHNIWLETIAGFENEPERGKRCGKCFEYSLTRTSEKASQLKIPFFTTTLTVSPHKISKVIFEIGHHMNGFLPIDFKKNDGFKRSMELSKKHNFYRQSYCGCEFSHRTDTCPPSPVS